MKLFFLTLLEQKCEMLAESPYIGVEQHGCRMFPVERYKIYYETSGDVIEVVRILHGARQIEALFEIDSS